MQMPLFPHSCVLLPGGRLRLQIFEPRYLELVSSCLKRDSGFGLIWIADGSKAAPGGDRLPRIGEFGCQARIVDWDTLPNGLLGITIEGGERFRLLSAGVAGNKLVVGEVEMAASPAPVPMQKGWNFMVDVLSQLQHHPQVKQLGMKSDYSNAWQVAFMLAQLLPMDERARYHLLQVKDIETLQQRLDRVLEKLSN